MCNWFFQLLCYEITRTLLFSKNNFLGCSHFPAKYCKYSITLSVHHITVHIYCNTSRTPTMPINKGRPEYKAILPKTGHLFTEGIEQLRKNHPKTFILTKFIFLILNKICIWGDTVICSSEIPVNHPGYLLGGFSPLCRLCSYLCFTHPLNVYNIYNQNTSITHWVFTICTA